MTADVKPQDATTTPQPQAVPEVPELVAAGPDNKNWRGIGIALLVIVAVCALIVTAIVLLTPGDKGPHVKSTKINLDEVVKGYYSYRRFNGTWLSGNEFIFQDPFGALEIYDVTNNSKQVIMSNTTFRQYSISQYSISSDRKYILLAHKQQRIFRHTYISAFLVYNISQDHLSPLFPESPELLLQYAAWGPKGNQLVYVLDNNVYYMPEIGTESVQLTTNGVLEVIFNGIPDWVYEEEILSSSHALWWSPDGSKLCFASFNDSQVEEIKYPYYGSYSETNNVYPKTITLKYPKAGRTNPTVTIWVSDLAAKKRPQQVEPPREYKDLDYYFTDVQWVNNSAVSVIWLRRAQNSSVISVCPENNAWLCRKNLQEESKGAWVDLNDELLFSKDSKYYFVRLPGPSEGSAGRFRHVAMIDTETGNKEFLTKGKFDVTSILTHNQEKNTVYYIATLEGKSGERHLFGVTDLRASAPRKVTCYTCDLDKECLYNSASFSEDALYYVLECLGPGVPKLQLWSADPNKLVEVLDTNDELKERISTRALPQVKFFQVPINENYNANVRLYLPPTLREDEITKYPMLVEVYGGPGSQLITEKFSIGWGTYLASKKNIIYAVIDGRGSGNRGDRILHELYRRLGTIEVFDQIAVTGYLKNELHFIDGSKIAIFGWSYGGYVTAMALATDDKVFSCGISVAPVTNWLYYDSVYTERYMQSPSPKDNYLNYENADVMKKAANFKGKKGKKYLLIHGTADDNVHWQQSAMLSKALTDAGVLFRMQVYPDETHALSNVKMHLYRTMDDFLDQCFTDNDDDDSFHSQNSNSER